VSALRDATPAVLSPLSLHERSSDLDRLQGVLVDGVGVVHVELGLADDPAPLRQESAEQTGLVHQGQHPVGPLSVGEDVEEGARRDRKSTRLNSSHVKISYAVFCLKK